MKKEEIREKIEDLIREGTEKYKTTKKTKYYIDSEYNVVYSDAVNFLIESYNKNTELEINNIFNEKIPKLFNNKECENVLEEFENLKSDDLIIRKKASKFFRQKALNTTIGYRSMIFKRPETFEYLITALENEKDEKIIINLIIAIAGAHNRYFKYFKVYEVLIPYLTNKKADIRYYAIIWTDFLSKRDANRERLLNEIYKTEKSKKVKEIITEQLKYNNT